MSNPPAHMSPEEFRRHGHAAVDWVASYLERLETFPVLSRAAPGDLRAALPAAAPERGEPFDVILADVERLILPGITHWQSPNFFAYFSGNASPPAVLAELVSAGLGVQGMLWATSPACTELETHVLDWLAGALGLPAAFTSRGAGGGVIQDTASSATLCALLAARDRTTDGAATERGTPAGLVAYASAQAHSSVPKAAGIAGLGRAHLRSVDVDGTYAMRPEALDEAIRADRAAGRAPCFAVATVGTTSSTAMDPVRAVGEVCRRHGVWLHVDAALAGSAALCPEFRHFQDGLELADSYCVNPHKWMLTNFDCDAFYVADRAALLRALSILPEYLRNQATEAGAVIDYRDWQIPLGRRFRALKLWFVMRSYGLEGLRRHIRHHVDLARQFAEWVRADARFEIVAPVPLSLVCFRLRGADEPNERLLAAINATGEAYLTHTRLDGRFVLRLAVGATFTAARHVEAAWRRIRACVTEAAS
ncbi:MAG TPA: pyridoxal-dependent decarboxylase [Gemmatimonadales bacterium]